MAAQPRRAPTAEPWRDPARSADERVADLLSRMTLAEKVAQLGSIWQGASGEGDGVAPMQDQFNEEQPPLDELIKNGLGQLTRVYGSRPVPAAAGMQALAGLQARIMASSRFGIPAVAHEECLTGFAAWGATIYPTSLAWGASFDPALVARDGGGVRRDHAGGRRPPGARAGPRRDPRLPVGPGRGDHRRGPVPGRDRRHRLRAGAAVGRGAGDAQALRRVLRVAGRPEPRAGLDGPARVRRRHPPPVRDGDQNRRRPVGDADLHRPRRHARQRRPEPADRTCSATSSASTASSSPTTSRSPSSSSSTGSRPTRPARPRWRSRPGLTWSCRAPAASATRCWRRSPRATSPRS